MVLYFEIWDSAIATGEIRLLESEQIKKLAIIYRFIKDTSTEAIRRDSFLDNMKILPETIKSIPEIRG